MNYRKSSFEGTAKIPSDSSSRLEETKHPSSSLSLREDTLGQDGTSNATNDGRWSKNEH